MLTKLIGFFAGDPAKRTLDKNAGLVQKINALEPELEKLSNDSLRAKTDEFKTRLSAGETLDDLLPEAFAVVREASKRTMGMRHYDVQLIGGISLHRGSIAEMRTGEGKTLVATLPLYLNSLAGKGAHLITVNDYLARRDARWMAPIYTFLGLKVGVLQMAARTENGQKAFLIDLERSSLHEDQHQLDLVPRRQAYEADITYGTNSEFGFDYLRDNMTMRLEDRVQRGHAYAIVDEVDNVLIDEARTPLIISGPASEDVAWYERMAQVVRGLRPEDYEINEKDRNVTLSEVGGAHVEELLGLPLRDPDRPEDVTHEQARLIGYLEQALRAQFLFRQGKDYLVQAGKVVIVDEFTGRLMPGRRWSDGLHQAVEAKEGQRVQPESVTYATITIQNYFRMYAKLAGMTGTALTESEEFHKIYKLEVTAIPTNLEYQAARPDAPLQELDGKDELGYKYRYYIRRADPAKKPAYWRRKDYPDVVYRTEEAKFRAIAQEIIRGYALGRPVLVGTTSVELSDRLSDRLKVEAVRRLCQAMLLRHYWMKQHNREEDGLQVAELQYLNAPLTDVQTTDMRKMARELNVSLSPDEGTNLTTLLEVFSLPAESMERVKTLLQAGIPHRVLNARLHTEESQIIAGAGSLGAVTIATNMAGRGVDIRLGGEIPESEVNEVRLLLRRADIAQKMQQNGLPPIDELPLHRWAQALDLVDEEELRSRAEAVDALRTYLHSEKRVRELGGLHVIGSERHEARRIDNQLRGRAARQGDPGSSRFYLSMEDDLMRRFGGQQADGLMQRLKVDDMLPLEVGLVSRLVEQAQTRVEGSNFDVRKHLLEYDDVLNSQRSKIYGQRDRIFTKDDLHEDVTEMLRVEVRRRVPEALKDDDGPWKLLAWLDQVQPTLQLGSTLYPSFTMRLLMQRMTANKASLARAEDVQQSLVALAADSLHAEKSHILRAINEALETLFDRLKAQVRERNDMLDTFLEALASDEGDGEDARPRSGRELADELAAALHLPIRLTNEQQRTLREKPAQLKQPLRGQIEEMLRAQALTRLVGTVERRLEESSGLNVTQLAAEDQDVIEQQVIETSETLLARRQERLVGPEGQITRDIAGMFGRLSEPLTESQLLLMLMQIPQGLRSGFDRKTHKRVTQRTTRLTYLYAAARLLEGRRPDDLAEDVLEHLEEAQEHMRLIWGEAAWPGVAAARWDTLAEPVRRGLESALGEEKMALVRSQALQSLDTEDVRAAVAELGRQHLTEIYRYLLLQVITELWVDYLTQMEALRVSIGLEAYGQRDPLVQYKARASELFQNLLRDMRSGVITRMFTYQPRSLNAAGSNRSAAEAGASESAEAGSAAASPASAAGQAEDSSEDLSNLSKSQKRRMRRR